MKFEVYCDESHPDVFWSESADKAKYLLIGGLWLPAKLRSEVKQKIGELKQVYHFPHEAKWHKVHKDNEPFYLSLIDLFFSYGDQLRFRCIAVEAAKVDMVQFHDNDRELGFYKFYYQLLKHWILDFNEYRVFCDEKTTRAPDRLTTLKRVLGYVNASSRIVSVQALPSDEVVLIQLVDVLLGAASSRLNTSVATGSTKDRLIKALEQRLGVRRLGPTPRSEEKFNVFKINLRGGW